MGVAVGEEEEENIFLSCARALTDVFQKNEKKNKTTSVYRLILLWS